MSGISRTLHHSYQWISVELHHGINHPLLAECPQSVCMGRRQWCCTVVKDLDTCRCLDVRSPFLSQGVNTVLIVRWPQSPTGSVTDWSQSLASPDVSLPLAKGVWSLCYSLFMQVGWWGVYSPLLNLIFAWFCSLKLLQGREQTSVFCRGTRVFCLSVTFMANLLCYCNACPEEKLLPRLCVPVGMSPFFPSDGLVAARLGWALQ